MPRATSRLLNALLITAACGAASAQQPAPVFTPQGQPVPTAQPAVVVAPAKAAAATASAIASGKMAVTMANCGHCVTVQEVKKEKRRGHGGALGVAGGAVAGGLLGNQIGKGDGKTVATVGGAVAGGLVGNEIQKQMTRKTVWVTTVKLRDGSTRKFEQDKQPSWAVGSIIAMSDKGLSATP